MDPDTQHMFDAIGIDPYRNMGGLVTYVAHVTDLDNDCIEIFHGIQRFERALLPGKDFVGDSVNDVRNRLVAQISTIVEAR